MLRDVVAEIGLPKVCEKYQITRGAVQGLQASASIFAGFVPPLGPLFDALHLGSFVASRVVSASGLLLDTSLAGMVSTFCARLQWWQFQALCNSFTGEFSRQ